MTINADFRVIDLFNGKVIESNETPEFTGTLYDVIRQFQGQTYMLSQNTGFIDFKGNKIYEHDYIFFYDLKSNALGETIYTKIGEGRVKLGVWGTCVESLNKETQQIDTYYLSNQKTDFEKIGDYFYRNKH